MSISAGATSNVRNEAMSGTPRSVVAGP